MIIIDKISYSSKLIKVNPMEKFLFSILTLIICLLFDNTDIHILVILIISLMIIGKAKIPYKIYGGLLIIPLIFLLLSIAPLMISSSYENALIYFNIFNIKLGVTKNSLNLAFNTFFKAFSCISCLYFLILTTPSSQILSVLRKLKAPKLFTEFMGLIYRCIFIIVEVSSMIVVSQNSRLGYLNFKKSLNSISKLIAALFIMSYKKAEDMFLALESRTYNGEIRFLDIKYDYSIKNIFYIIVFQLILIVIAIKF